MNLTIKPNIADPDGFYQELIEAQRDMDDEQAAILNAKLIIILANHIGDADVLSDAIALAARGAAPTSRTN